MSDAVFMDFEEPTAGRRGGPGDPGKGKKGKKKDKKSKAVAIPKLPPMEKPLTGSEVRRGVSDRFRAAAKLKAKGWSYLDIADELEFADAREARKAVESVIAATLEPEEIETQRAIVISRGEELFKQSLAFAQATHFVTEDGERLPNIDQLRWHQQASTDLMNIATLTGAKAPTKVEFTPGEAELERIVNEMVSRAGHEDIVDAEVIDLDIPREIEADYDDEA